MSPYTLTEEHEGLVIRRADGSWVFTLVLQDEALARAILDNLNTQDSA